MYDLNVLVASFDKLIKAVQTPLYGSKYLNRIKFCSELFSCIIRLYTSTKGGKKQKKNPKKTKTLYQCNLFSLV